MLGTREDIARFHSDFYRDKYRKALRNLIFSTLLVVALICVIIYLVLFKESPQYYATTTEGQIIPMVITESK
jgi:amino acid permease